MPHERAGADAVSRVRFATIRGIPLHDVRLTFTHENVD